MTPLQVRADFHYIIPRQSSKTVSEEVSQLAMSLAKTYPEAVYNSPERLFHSYPVQTPHPPNSPDNAYHNHHDRELEIMIHLEIVHLPTFSVHQMPQNLKRFSDTKHL